MKITFFSQLKNCSHNASMLSTYVGGPSLRIHWHRPLYIPWPLPRLQVGLEHHQWDNIYQSGVRFFKIIYSGQIIIFHQPRSPWNKGISLTKPPFGMRSCEVAIIWPDIFPIGSSCDIFYATRCSLWISLRPSNSIDQCSTQWFSCHGNLRGPPNATTPRNKALLRDY